MAVLVCGSPPASAQVSVDLHALDKLPQSQPAPSTGPTAAPAPRPPRAAGTAHADRPRGHAHERNAHAESRKPAAAAHADTHGKPPPAATAPAATAAAPAKPPPPAATLPTAAPPPVVLAPMPAAPIINADKPPVGPEIGGDTSWLPDGMRVMFQPGKADLSSETTDAVRHLALMVPASDQYSVDVRAYAAAVPDDPSASRRLALSRSLAIRTALMSEGIPSTRIFLRALGANAGNGPADRCDIMVSRLGAEPPVPGAPVPGAPVAGAPTAGAPTAGTPTAAAPVPGAPVPGAPPNASSATAAAVPRPTAGPTPAPTARP